MLGAFGDVSTVGKGEQGVARDAGDLPNSVLLGVAEVLPDVQRNDQVESVVVDWVRRFTGVNNERWVHFRTQVERLASTEKRQFVGADFQDGIGVDRNAHFEAALIAGAPAAGEITGIALFGFGEFAEGDRRGLHANRFVSGECRSWSRQPNGRGSKPGFHNCRRLASRS